MYHLSLVVLVQYWLSIKYCTAAQVDILRAEQRAGFRRKGSLIPLRHCKGNFDISIRLKSVLIRRDLFKHLAGLFKKFDADILTFMEPDWYAEFLGTEQEAEGAADQPEDDDDMKVEVGACLENSIDKAVHKAGEGAF